RPSFSILRGPRCQGHLACYGAGKDNADDLMSLPTGNPLLAPGDPANSGTLVAYIQSGMGGATPRPEITRRDMVDLIKFLQTINATTVYPTTPAPMTDPVDTVPPLITNVSAVHNAGAKTLTITFTTDKAAICFGMAGSAYQASNQFYNVYSPVESNYT